MSFLRTGAAPVETGVTLELTLDVPSIVTDVSKFIISGGLTNTGSRTISVVRDPSGPLFEGFAANAYQFKKTGGKSEEPEFVGTDAKWTLDSYLKQPGRPQTTGLDGKPLNATGFGGGANDDDSGSTGNTESATSEQTRVDGNSPKYNNPFQKAIHELRSEESLMFKSYIGDAYNFTEAGPGEYEVELWRKTFFVLIDGGVQEINVDAKPSIVNIDGKLAGSPPEDEDHISSFSKRDITAKKCNAMQSLVIKQAAERADEYVKDSIRTLHNMKEETTRYRAWFGLWVADYNKRERYTPRNQAQFVYMSLRSFKASARKGYTYECSCPDDLNIYAYTTRSLLLRRPVIHLCSKFFTEDVSYEGQNSKAGILIQQATTFGLDKTIVPVRMVERGRVRSYHLSQNRPHFAVANADNYEYFAENVPLSKEEDLEYRLIDTSHGELNSKFRFVMTLPKPGESDYVQL